MFEAFRRGSDGKADAQFVKEPFGTFYIEANEFSRIVGDELGEYKLSLDRVDYNYCQDGQEKRGNPYARVCQVNFVVTDHYLMQKGTTATQANTDLGKYHLLDGDSLYNYLALRNINQLKTVDYNTLSPKLKTLTDNLIKKYDKIAGKHSIGELEAKKVPGQEIYILPVDKVLDGSQVSKPATFIVKGNLTIKGNISKNVLIIAQGTVKFEMNAPTADWNSSCGTQEIKGIIVAQRGFVASE